VYIEQPQAFVIHGKESHVCKLKKKLHGLKRAHGAWYARIDNYLMSLGFTKSDADPNLYYKVENGCPLILVLYVDDISTCHPYGRLCQAFQVRIKIDKL
jgi:hypothetical protein